jgi:REP element-mobilizing transposase RayT
MNKFFLSNTAKDIVLSTIHFYDKKKYNLHAFVIMDTHVHCILEPLSTNGKAFYSLANITHNIISYSANRIQRILKKTGSIWQDESYDQLIRDDKEYFQEMDYIANNAVQARLVEKPEEYRWLYVNHKHGGL